MLAVAAPWPRSFGFRLSMDCSSDSRCDAAVVCLMSPLPAGRGRCLGQEGPRLRAPARGLKRRVKPMARRRAVRAQLQHALELHDGFRIFLQLQIERSHSQVRARILQVIPYGGLRPDKRNRVAIERLVELDQ